MMKLEELLEAEKKQGTYAGYHFDKGGLKELAAWSKENKIPNRVPSVKTHCTLLFSRKHCPDYEPLGKLDPPIECKYGKMEIWETQDKKHALVIKINAPEMSKRHKKLMDELDATYDYDEYKTHITLSYDVGEDFDISSLTKDHPSTIKAVEEYTEELQLDWQNK